MTPVTASSPLSAYLAVLRLPRAAPTFAAALVGRLSYGTVPLSLLLALRASTGSFSVAGTALALFGAGSVLLTPARAALIDRWGPRAALVPLAAAYAAVLALLALAALSWSLPGWAAAGGAALAGTLTPPLGPVMRTRWAELTPDRGLLSRALSLDSVAEEVLFVVGPLVAGALAAAPALGVLTGSALVVSGAAGLAWSAPPGGAAPSAGGGVTGGFGPARALLPVLPPALALGLALGAFDLLAAALCEAHHSPGTTGQVLAALGVGSALGGLVHGAVRPPASRLARLCRCTGALGAALALAGWAPGPYALAAAAAVAGVFVAPALTTAYLAADEAAPPGARTRAGSWVNTAVNAGMSAGSASAGLLVGRLPLPLCFGLAALPALLSAAGAGRRRSGGVPVASDRPGEVPAPPGPQRTGSA